MQSRCIYPRWRRIRDKKTHAKRVHEITRCT
nr:MAG TPA: hypothetical protein [Caudoviricetes sp.]